MSDEIRRMGDENPKCDGIDGFGDGGNPAAMDACGSVEEYGFAAILALSAADTDIPLHHSIDVVVGLVNLETCSKSDGVAFEDGLLSSLRQRHCEDVACANET
jgi:hypothetical protein